jgi:hypothetical protein
MSGSQTSTSGPIIAATLTDSSASEIMSTAVGSQKTVTVTINVVTLQDSGSIASPPIQLALGGNQGNGSLKCGNNGGPVLQADLANGCPATFTTTTAPVCSGTSCAYLNPGNGKLDKILDPAMNDRMNGGSNKTCLNPNHWTGPDSTIYKLQTYRPIDPRLITLLITDNGALIGANGSTPIPIRAFATFYVTGWMDDPCTGSGISSNGLPYVPDDLVPSSAPAPTGVLMGHFVNYNGPGIPGPLQCTQTTFGNCVPVLTK